jgi:thiamine biosynthesis protein ThiC
MKIFVTNVFFDEELSNDQGITKVLRRDIETGENIEIQEKDLIIRKSGTVILLAESQDTVFAELQAKVSDKIVEVEIVDEIDLQAQAEEIEADKVMPLSEQDDTQSLKGRIIFQSNI